VAPACLLDAEAEHSAAVHRTNGQHREFENFARIMTIGMFHTGQVGNTHAGGLFAPPPKIHRAMYAPHTQRDVEQMLGAIGIGSLDDLLRVPDDVALKAKLEVVPALPEYQIQRRFDHFAEKNAGVEYRSFLGAGGNCGAGNAR
jgi:hypothetical protein